jgi:hypothetical protein
LSSRTAILVCLLSTAGALTARCGGPVLSSDSSSWQQTDSKSGVTIYSRSRLGSSLKEFKGTGLIDMPPATVEKVLADTTEYPRFMPYVSSSRIVGHDGDATLNYQLLDVPFVSPRDYTVRVEHGITTGTGGAATYRDTWRTANEAGPASPPGTVRVKVNEGSWLLQPAGADGKQTQATYQIYTDNGGVVPAFLDNHASQVIIPKLFDAIRKEAHDPKYAAAGQ